MAWLRDLISALPSSARAAPNSSPPVISSTLNPSAHPVPSSSLTPSAHPVLSSLLTSSAHPALSSLGLSELDLQHTEWLMILDGGAANETFREDVCRQAMSEGVTLTVGQAAPAVAEGVNIELGSQSLGCPGDNATSGNGGGGHGIISWANVAGFIQWC